MAEQTPVKPTIRFLSFSNDKEDAEKVATLKEAAAKIEQAIARKRALDELVDCPVSAGQEPTINPETDTRSLYERLQEQRNKKKETIEEAQKLSNLVAHLDEDDANYLNEVARNRREVEMRKRLEVHDALEAKKRLDEQKMADQEKRMRENLLGVSGKDSKVSSRSRLSSMIKMKPKHKANAVAEVPSASKNIATQQSGPTSAKRLAGLYDKQVEEPPSKRPASESMKREISPARRQDCGVQDGTDMCNQSCRQQKPQQEPCGCLQKVTKVFGIMPSSLIVRESPNDSDETDHSDDDSDRGLMPRDNRRRR